MNDENITGTTLVMNNENVKNNLDRMQGHWHSFQPSSKMVTYGYTWNGKDATNKEAEGVNHVCMYP